MIAVASRSGPTEALEVEPLRRWFSAVAEAALPFESRWTERALKRVDPDLYEAWSDQRSMWMQAQITGTAEDIDEHGAAMVRAWQAVARRMEASGEPDDAYMLGFDGRTGTRIAVGEQKAAVARIRELHGDRVTWITPDEIAALLAGVEAFERVAAVKKLWPGAEIVEDRA